MKIKKDLLSTGLTQTPGTCVPGSISRSSSHGYHSALNTIPVAHQGRASCGGHRPAQIESRKTPVFHRTNSSA